MQEVIESYELILPNYTLSIKAICNITSYNILRYKIYSAK
jgi:hypothetical protein